MAILGTITNSMTIAAIISGKLHHQACFIKILNLNFCNLIHCMIFLPLMALQAFTGIWTENTLLCNAVSYALFANMGTELWGYVCITLNRYFSVVNYKLHNWLYGNIKLVVFEWILTWSIYPIILAPPLFGVWSQYTYAPKKLVCHPFRSGGTECTGYCLFVFLTALLTTAPLIVYCYLHIIYVYIKIRNKINLSRESSAIKHSSQISTEGSHWEFNLTKAEVKMAFTILAVILVFAASRVPFILLYMYDPTMTKVDPIVHSVLIYSGTNSNWINPIIYCLTNRQIRTSYVRLIKSFRKMTLK